MKKTLYSLFIALFFALCLVPSVGMVIHGPSEAAANEPPAAAPRVKNFDGTWNDKVLTQVRDAIGKGFYLRLEGITAWDTLADRVFHTSGNDDVLIGPDGWLFFGGAVNDISGAEQMTDRQIWCAARGLALMEEYAGGQGAKLVFTVPCGKYTLYPAHAPVFVTVAESSNRERLQAALEEQGVTYADLYAAFAAVDEELYWQWDSHWTERGAALGADAILAALGRESDWFAGPFGQEQTHRGDLYTMLYPRGKARETTYTWQPGFTFAYTSPFHDYDDMLITTETEVGQGSLLLFRDSSGRSLYPYLAQSFGRACVSRLNNYRLDWIAQERADTVVLELAERTLPNLLKYPAVYPAPERDAAVLDGAWPIKSDLAAEDVDGTLPGCQKLTGDLIPTAVDSPVYLEVNGAVYEAIPNEGSFTAWLPAWVEPDSVCVYIIS